MSLLSRKSRFAAVGVTALITSLSLAVAPMAVGDPVEQANYQMNEPGGATTMIDSSGNGLNGTIDQSGLDTGVAFGGAIGYSWARKPPESLPVAPERVIQVPDNPALDPRGDTFTVEVRYRTKEKFGNIIQKGQSRTVGGQWKIQNPQGRPSCLFKSPTRSGAIRSDIFLNDNQWHVLKCVRTATAVEIWIDGVFHKRKNGWTGVIDNKKPLVIGGKIECDQITVTCDYYSGMIDWVRITRGT